MSEKTTTKTPVIRPDRVTFRDSIRADSKYDPKFAELLFRHLSKGLSFSCFDVGVSHSTLLNWLRHDSFAMARERGEKKRLQLLEAAGIKMVIEGNATAWKFMMQDYGMTEKVEVFLSEGSEAEDNLLNVTPERQKRLERIREIGKRLKLK